MHNTRLEQVFKLTCIAALVGGMPAALADELTPERIEAIGAMTAMGPEVKAGLSAISDDNTRLGQYTGMRDSGAYLILDGAYRSLEQDSGTWMRANARNLGLDTRELDFEHYRQGVWRYAVGFGQTIRHEPNQVVTGLTGIGETSSTVNGTALRPVDIKMQRDLVSFSGEIGLSSESNVRLRYTHEDKEGARLFGRGNFGIPAAIEFLAEPIDRNTQTLELAGNYSGKALQLSGGYYGTLFTNHAERLDVASSTNNVLSTPAAPTPAWSPMSMPLSNQSHQLFLTGGYNISPLTRLSLRTTRTTATQDEQLISVTQPAALTNAQGQVLSLPALANAPDSLDGKVVTTIGYIDLTSMEIDRLDLQANIRYEDRHDHTPFAKYLNLTSANFVSGYNKPRSWRSVKSKFEAGYQLPFGFKAVGGIEVDNQERNYPEPYRRVAFRAKTDETTSRAEIKRIISESATGSVSYSEARRRGSQYITDTLDTNAAVAGIQPSSDINPLIWADRDRGTWRVSADWAPLDELTLSFSGDKSNDMYSGRDLGPRDGERAYYSVSAGYALSRRLQLTGFISRDDTHARQFTHTNQGPTQQWAAHLRQLGTAAGIGLHGNLRNGIEFGADLTHYRDVAEQRYVTISPVVPGSFEPGAVSPPDYEYRTTELKLSGKYPLDKRSSVLVEYQYRDWQTDDWTWRGWTYSDGTTLVEKPEQRTHYLGAAYRYRWW